MSSSGENVRGTPGAQISSDPFQILDPRAELAELCSRAGLQQIAPRLHDIAMAQGRSWPELGAETEAQCRSLTYLLRSLLFAVGEYRSPVTAWDRPESRIMRQAENVPVLAKRLLQALSGPTVPRFAHVLDRDEHPLQVLMSDRELHPLLAALAKLADARPLSAEQAVFHGLETSSARYKCAELPAIAVDADTFRHVSEFAEEDAPKARDAVRHNLCTTTILVACDPMGELPSLVRQRKRPWTCLRAMIETVLNALGHFEGCPKFEPTDSDVGRIFIAAMNSATRTARTLALEAEWEVSRENQRT